MVLQKSQFMLFNWNLRYECTERHNQSYYISIGDSQKHSDVVCSYRRFKQQSDLCAYIVDSLKGYNLFANIVDSNIYDVFVRIVESKRGVWGMFRL